MPSRHKTDVAQNETPTVIRFESRGYHFYMSMNSTTHQVFGISKEIRPYSYVDRSELDHQLQTLLMRDTHIALRGESKCGKSWFRQKNIPNALVVQCRLGKSDLSPFLRPVKMKVRSV
jgi:hypothetical protein